MDKLIKLSEETKHLFMEKLILTMAFQKKEFNIAIGKQIVLRLFIKSGSLDEANFHLKNG